MRSGKRAGKESGMKSEKIIFSLLGTIVKVVVVFLLVKYIYQNVLACYNYGQRILDEPAMTVGEGKRVVISYTEGMSPLDLGDMMEKKGLSRDGKLFALQYLFSEYREDMKTGTYEVNTAMTAEEIMETIAAASREAEEQEPEDDN